MTAPVATHILIVEDDRMLREAFRIMLEDAGYIVSEAGSAAQALHQVHEQKPRLMILDLGLPDRSGLEVARELKRDPATAQLVIVALTGRVGSAEKRACIDAGCKAYFAKPITPSALLKKLPGLLA